MMGQGDRVTLTMHDTPHGVRAELDDQTTRQSGSMVASAANGFGQIAFNPAPATACTENPYDFHPMYSTSAPQIGAGTLWSAHTGNVSFSLVAGFVCGALAWGGYGVGRVTRRSAVRSA